MSSLVKFWIAATLVLFLLTLWPALQMSKSSSTSGGSSRLAEEAKLVDFFCLARIPTGGRANIPTEWEKALKADIKVRENAGEAASDIGLPRERQDQITSLQPGMGLTYSDKGKSHYVLRSGQGRDWYLVLTKESSGMLTSNNEDGGSPSPIALAVAFALVGGLLLTLLAKVAFGSAPART